MSAIFGQCYTDNRPVDAGQLDQMLATLNHWQADAANIWGNGNVGMGHLMLYNTPESLEEKLPLTDSLAQLTITADARIDNRDELFGLLGITTPGEKKMPDSQLLLLAYKKFGVDCVLQLIGDFAFAIWDGQNQRLFCARDQMGVKPFFYYFRDHFFVFATEKKALLCLPQVDTDINKQYFYNQCFGANIQAADTTLYRHMQRIAPGHSLTLSLPENKLTLRHYWTLDAEKEILFKRKEDYYDGLRHHFETAVQCRLRSNYPVGIELSGGMDSSSITGVAAHLLKGTGRPLTTFTNGESADSLEYTARKGKSEIQFAEAVIQFNQIANPVFIRGNISDDPMEVLELLTKINDGLERANIPWQLPIKQEAMARGIRTVFSGFPGDEMATYRGDYYFLDYLDQKQYLKYFNAKDKYWFKKYKPFLGPGVEYVLHKLNNARRINQREVKKAALLFRFPLKYQLNRGDEAWQDETFCERFNSYRHYQKYRLLKTPIPQRMEAETHYGTWFRSEARFPMADIRLTQFYLSMPNNLKYEGELTRSAWRRSMENYLPAEVMQRDTKLGIMTPYNMTPKRIEAELDALRAMVADFPLFGAAKKKQVMEAFEKTGGTTKYNIIFYWFKKNFEKL